ncbi:uncharacterized protein LOC119837213 [Zerene cesonia]|uniref:uncharacterized protein LOC119837213 n=1 Tax=Zerene cesonia TaxID=33412 RepID=UPI0018E52971|nr:uncharacterized protein LOC119837213 [Zerene cesonia]
MNVGLLFVVLVLLAFAGTPVTADFFYNPNPPKIEELGDRGLKCVPGRTIIKIVQKPNITQYETEEEDYIWHRDEIPYEAKSKCLRGTSYYSNSLNANDTDIDVASEIESLLDYDNIDVCFFCVCSVDAKAASCINRDPWFCEYYRIIKEPDAMRHKYTKMFQQDRPAYFRQLSYRLRRTMDDSMFELIDKVGDKIDDSKCVPFVSEYSDCTDENMCTGCTKCHCTEEGKWACKDIISCPDDDDGEENSLNGDSVYSAIDVLMSGYLIAVKEKH